MNLWAFFPYFMGVLFFTIALIFTTSVVVFVKSSKLTKKKMELEIEVLAAKLKKTQSED